ncbi:tetratricopeptide repeat-containing sensor histidine kinase [Emticicia sp. SJ17W-69]|uniref:tetratricopeptide repeat-containing sensor histidine kinase n=1 Tax=Emticicia sp. SJ17W-69 TaxID=3421657 RepID=UPI003EB847D2
MKTILITFFLVCSGLTCFSQNRQDQIDRLKHQLAISKSDTNQVKILVQLFLAYRQVKPDSSLFFTAKSLDLSRKLNFPNGEVEALLNLSALSRIQGDVAKSLKYLLMALGVIEQKAPLMDKSHIWNGIGLIYLEIEDHPKALEYFRKALSSTESGIYGMILMNMERTFINTNQLDSALNYSQKAYNWGKIKYPKLIYYPFYMYMGIIQFRLGNRSLGFENLHKSISGELKNNDHRRLADCYSAISEFFKETKQLDSCIFYAKKGLIEGQTIGYQKSILINANLLAEQYEKKDIRQSLYYYKIAKAANEELYGAKRIQALQKSMADEQERQRNIEIEQVAYQNRLRQFILLVGLGVFLLITFLLYRNNQKEKKAKNLLEEKNNEIQSTLFTLKSTQNQLIQKEKLASLGELTAGIAHEIQNPLNFVNNFSELSGELIDEMNEEIDNGNLEEVKAISGDLKQNLEKINHHGKRASSIVKGMLEHSRTSTGIKELTDINALADEYLRLSYHGLRAKDKNFNSDFKTDFDENLPKIEVIPQDFGRVLLNLINNAFYAIKDVPHLQGVGHLGKVTVSTQKIDNQVIIKVKDNGTGMSESTKTKIFQPFFTTKPTGQGTGLGLSLAYDIITKGHGGTIECESVEGEGSTFIVKLPL